MLRNSNEFLANNLISVSKSIIINRIGRGSKIDGAKSKAKCISRKNRKIAKSKILVKPENHYYFSKSIESTSRLAIFIYKVRLEFTKLR